MYKFETTTPVLAINDLREILDSNLTVEELVDELLHFDAVMYQNLGKESPRYERRAVKRTSKIIYNHLIKIDHEKFSFLSVE